LAHWSSEDEQVGDKDPGGIAGVDGGGDEAAAPEAAEERRRAAPREPVLEAAHDVGRRAGTGRAVARLAERRLVGGID